MYTTCQIQQPAKSSPIYRENTFGGNTGRNDLRNIGRQTTASTYRTIGFPVLNFRLKTKTVVEIGNSQVNFHLYIPDKKIQCKLIRDIYPILKIHPQFKEHKKQWEANTKPLEVLNWIAEQFNSFNINWIIANDDETKNNYHIVIYQQYNTVTNFYAMPLSFLPILKQKNLILHDLVIALIALINKHTSIDKWDSGYGAMAAETMRDEWKYNRDEMELNETETERYELAVRAYKKGFPYEYAKLINKDKSTLIQLEREIHLFSPSDKMETDFSGWIKQGLEVLRLNKTIHSFCFNPNDPVGNHLTPDKYFCFVWDWEDKVFEYHDMYIQNDFENQDTVPFCEWKIWRKDDKQLENLNFSDFPKLIETFFDTGTNLIQQHFYNT